MAKDQETLFKRLTRLFRSGPVVKRKVRALDTRVAIPDRHSSAVALFQKSTSPVYSSITANAYNMSERLMRYQDFGEMEYCLSGDTKIAIPGGYKTIKELADEYGLDKQFIVYSYDHNQKRIVPALAKQARQTRVDESFKVTFDNGTFIIGTSNHRLLKRDGTFCKIEDLAPGDAMMPFYRRDLFNGCKESGDGYRWIYTMDKNSSMNGWVAEHRVIGEFIEGRPLRKDEVVHHKNFIKYDNNIDNLAVMTDLDHKRLHAEILNGAKWSELNSEWIEKFKINHSKFMTDNNPAERKDITFGRILETCENVGFNLYRLCEAFDTDPNVIKRRIRKHGYSNFETFAKAYNPDWQNAGWDNRGEKNPRFVRSVTFDKICSVFQKGMKLQDVASALGTSKAVVFNRIKEHGYKGYSDFSSSYDNLKVVSIEPNGVIPLYDLTVDGYKNFATDTVISHNTPELAAALDIYADETVAQDEKGRALHIYSDDPKIKEILEDLFYNTLNVEFNLRSWARNLCKYGDFFLYNDVSSEHGVLNAIPIPVNEIEREEGFDKSDPLAIRYRWTQLGNRVLENWEVTHFRLLGNDMFLPYGSSIIEPARRIWRQLILIEDAMLVYRVVRAPERRVFYIDVGNIEPEAIPTYIEQQRAQLRTNQVIDKTTGRVDLRYNPMSVDEDYFIPVRGGDSGTKIDTLAGGQNTAAVEDVAYIQKKLFAALKVPRAYLGYDEALSSKATLAQEDIRFSRTISTIQRVIISELNKLAIIHLVANGFEGEELLNFVIKLSNPSTIAQQQKLELYRAKFEIASSAPEGLVDRDFLRKNIFGLNDEEIEAIERGKVKDRQSDIKLENDASAGGSSGGGGGGSSLFGPSGGEESSGGEEDLFGGEAGGEEPAAGATGAEEETPPEENAGEEPEEETEPGVELLTSSEDMEDDPIKITMKPGESPLKAKNQVSKYLYNRSRKRTHGASATHMPDFNKMTGNDSNSMNDPFDQGWIKSIASNPFGEAAENKVKPALTTDVKRMIGNMGARFGWTKKFSEVNNGVLNENNDQEKTSLEDIDVIITGDDNGDS